MASAFWESKLRALLKLSVAALVLPSRSAFWPSFT